MNTERFYRGSEQELELAGGRSVKDLLEPQAVGEEVLGPELEAGFDQLRTEAAAQLEAT